MSYYCEGCSCQHCTQQENCNMCECDECFDKETYECDGSKFNSNCPDYKDH